MNVILATIRKRKNVETTRSIQINHRITNNYSDFAAGAGLLSVAGFAAGLSLTESFGVGSAADPDEEPPDVELFESVL